MFFFMSKYSAVKNISKSYTWESSLHILSHFQLNSKRFYERKEHKFMGAVTGIESLWESILSKFKVIIWTKALSQRTHIHMNTILSKNLCNALHPLVIIASIVICMYVWVLSTFRQLRHKTSIHIMFFYSFAFYSLYVYI